MRNTMNPHLPITHRLARSCSLAVVLACASLSAKALSLGHFSVESGLGQPLRAAIEITQYTVDDLRKLKVQLAQPGSFAQAGMVFQPALVGMQTRLEFRGNGKPFIALTGQTPVDEHFLDVIVEVQWPSGRLAMNYTLLVSPVGALPEKVANPASAQKPDGVLSPVVTAPVPAGDPPVATAQEASPLEVVTVRAGDTASQLALGKIPAAASMDQMLLAMVRANPEAFIEGNVHLLREGAQIKLPNQAQALAISAPRSPANRGGANRGLCRLCPPLGTIGLEGQGHRHTGDVGQAQPSPVHPRRTNACAGQIDPEQARADGRQRRGQIGRGA